MQSPGARPARLRLAIFVVALLGLLSLGRRLYQPVPGDGVEWSATASGLVARKAPADGPVRVGDRLLSIDGQPVPSRMDLLLLDRAGTEGAQRTYHLERDGESFTTDVALGAGSPPRAYLFLAIIGLAALATAVRLSARSTAAPGAAIAALAATAFAAIALLSPTGWLDFGDRVAIAVEDLSRVALPPLLLHAALALSGRTRRARWLYLPALALGAADLVYLVFGGRLPTDLIERVGLGIERLVHLHLVAFVGLAVAAAGAAFVAATGPQRERLRWLILAAGAGFGPYALAVALPAVFGLHAAPLAELALLPLAIVPIALGNAFMGRPLRLETLARNGLVLGASLLLTAGAALAAAAIAAELVRPLGLPAWTAYVVVALLVTAGFFERVRGAVRDWIEASFDRSRYDARRTLLEFGRDLAVEPSLVALSEALLDRLRRAFDLEQAALYVVGRETGDLRLLRVRPDGTELPATLHFTAEHPLVGGGIRVVDLREGRPDGVARVYDLAVPLVSRRRLVGLLLLGTPRRRLSDAERQLVGDLAGYAAVAVDNAALVGEIRHQVATVQELEQFRASVLESLTVGVLIVDLEGRILSTNRTLRDLIGQHEIPPMASASAILPAVFLDPPATGETERRSLDGRVLAIGTSLLRRTDGSVQGRILVVEDQTAVVAEEHERARREKLASIGLLSAGIAHEVNTPLAGIASYVQMLLETTPEGDPRRPLLAKVEKQSFRASRLVRNLLNFSRTKEESASPFDLNAAVTDAVSLIEHEARRRGVGIDVDLAPALTPALGRVGDIEQVVLNLVKNAIDATSAGGRIRLRSRSDRDDRIRLDVVDDGCGIAPGDVERVFDPFFTTKQRGAGHGLGLSVVYGIVKAHGGDIQVASPPEGGCQVTVSLPAAGVRSGGGGAQ